MEKAKRPRPGRPQGKLYPHRLMVFLDDSRQEALEERAQALSVSKARLIRDLIDDGIRRWRRGAE
jgi:hypothetical protein